MYTQAASDRSGIYVIKIGGSLITDKLGYCKPNYTAIAEAGASISKLLKSKPINLIVVLGGGSFGNAVPPRYHLLDNSQRRTIDIPRMTIEMFRWATIVCDQWRELNLACYPLQLYSLVSRVESKYVINSEAVKILFDFNLIPVIAGDILFSPSGIEVFSSDRIPLLFSEGFKIYRFVSCTDVDGVLIDGKVVENVNLTNYDSVLSHCNGSKKPDITGGMKTKVSAMWDLAGKNISSVICNGFDEETLMNAFFSNTPPGTYFTSKGKL